MASCSNAADTKLNQAAKPEVVIIDKCCSAQELETLLAWVHNSSSAALIIFVGDPLQLPPIIKTKHMSTAEELMNPFADQLCMSFFEHLWRRGTQVIMFSEEHRAAADFEQLYNKLFHGNRITNAPSTAIAKHGT